MSIPYTWEDKQLLTSILKRHQIVEDRRVDAHTNQLKNEAWEAITEEYNAGRTEHQRTVIQLKRCWDKMKRKRKEEKQKEKIERLISETGDRPTADLYKSRVNEVQDEVSLYDSDGVFSVKTEEETYLVNGTKNDSLSGLRNYADEMVYLPPQERPNTDSLSKNLIENAILERQHLIQLHQIRTEEAEERREEARIRKIIAETELLIKQEELKMIRQKQIHN
ncbi:unnamed protein product [Callosobruchus maculatus]|uniref:Regulatory protein zeste n=2 Tax=Callosobruchus maculatus TaxID=64391 RepID=A0A653CDG9_CALMS|nr:unnamed protein product [Callosobruchus maculatus]